MDKTQKKRTIIISVYAFLLVLLIFGIYASFGNDESCLDGIRNQNEDGVDCGGVCEKKNKCVVKLRQEIKVEETGFIEGGVAGKADVFGKIYNPNQEFGSSKFSYVFKIKNSEGSVEAIRSGTGYIFPGERKYIAEMNIDFVGEQRRAVELEILNIEWVESANINEKPQLKIVNKNYSEIASGVIFSEASGLLKNESPLDFDSIAVLVVLKNAEEKVVAMNSTKMNTVRSGESREFRAPWPNRFPGEVIAMDVQADVNVFNPESFSR